MKNHKGITLIALVVTIVVLLILAGVSIAMLGGENGIVTQAQKAKEQTKEEGAKEQIGVEVAGSYGTDGEIDISLLNKNLGNIEGLTYNGEKLSDTNKITSLPVEVELDGVKVKIAGNGKVTGSTQEADPPESVGGKKYEEETVITVDGTQVTVPEKFTISGLEDESTIEEGLVIYLVPDGKTVNWTDPEEVEYAKKNYDQFVWVPVPNAVLDLSANSEALSSEANIKAAVNAEIVQGRYPMAIKKADGNYFGVLYQFSLDSTTNAVKVESYNNWTPLCETSTRYREPAYLTNSSYADGSSSNNVGITESSLQEEFNTMVSRVSDKKGFWVGRYETSNMVSDNATNKITVIKGTTTGINSVNWYRMYAQQKSYSKLALGDTTPATSSMIWGSQWDQIMIWMKEVRNTNKNSYYVINSLTMGNYGTSDDSDTDTNNPAPTGNSENYKVKNVYDLAGNVEDWSLEADSTASRVPRGYGYSYTITSYTRADYRRSKGPNISSTSLGSRATLY